MISMSSCITVEWFLTERAIFQHCLIFLLFSKILANGNFCSEIESSKERKEAKTFLKKANMPKYATTDPNRVAEADLVKGGGFKLPDTLAT